MPLPTPKNPNLDPSYPPPTPVANRAWKEKIEDGIEGYSFDDFMAQFGETTEKELDDDEDESYTLKHLAGQHNQKRHAWRYSSNIPLSRLKKQRGQSEDEWTEYKSRVRSKRGGAKPGGGGGGKGGPVKKQTRGEIVAAKLRAIGKKPEFEAAKKERDEKMKAYLDNRAAIKQKEKELYTPSNYNDVAKRDSLRSEIKDLEGKSHPLFNEYSAANKIFEAQENILHSDYANALKVDNPASLNPFYHRMGTARREGFESAVEKISGIVSSDIMPSDVNLTIDGGKSPRAQYVPLGKKQGRVEIKVSGNRVLAHEIGHHIEHTAPGVFDKVKTFYEGRTAGNKTQRLSSIEPSRGYGPKEVTKVDKFITPYMGKFYNFGGGLAATELLSSGMEYLLSEPLTLLEKDPDFFFFLINTLQGD